MGAGRSGPGVGASRLLIRRRASWKDLFWRAARLFRIVALTRKPPGFGIVRTCSHLYYSRNLRGFRVFSGNPARRAIYHAWFRASGVAVMAGISILNGGEPHLLLVHRHVTFESEVS